MSAAALRLVCLLAKIYFSPSDLMLKSADVAFVFALKKKRVDRSRAALRRHFIIDPSLRMHAWWAVVAKQGDQRPLRPSAATTIAAAAAAG